MNARTWPAGMEKALGQWREACGDDAVLSGAGAVGSWLRNVSGLNRRIQAVLRPATADEAEQAVRIAMTHRIPIYPVSTGHNWGLGSRLPVTDDCVLLSLDRLNRILEIHPEHLYARIEPGVTQGQLFDHLAGRGDRLGFNVTGAGANTSIIGNALERGIGYAAGRAGSLSGMDIVLGTGKRLCTGFGWMPEARTTHIYRHGIGPGLEGLFYQSGFGVVVAAGIPLFNLPEQQVSLVGRLHRPDRLGDLIDALFELWREGTIRHVVHVANRGRSLSTLTPMLASRLNGQGDRDARARALLEKAGFGSWSAVIGLGGPAGLLRRHVARIRQRLRPLAKVSLLTDRRLGLAQRMAESVSFLPGMADRAALLDAIKPLHGLTMGIPSDEPQRAVAWPFDPAAAEANIPDPDTSRGGILYCLPFIPPEGSVAEAAVKATEQRFAAHGFDPLITLNLVDERALECVINVSFDRDNAEETDRAHACIDDVLAYYLEAGYPPYRVGIQHMGQMIRTETAYWREVDRLKNLFDPHGIMAPGRYHRVPAPDAT